MEDHNILPRFSKSELTLGSLVGKGGFSLVFDLVSIHIDEVFDISKSTAEARRNIAAKASDGHGTPKYVLKMLRDDLEEQDRAKGVIDLAVEARFLRKLSHPNIIAMVGTANSDPLESRYFVILEKLDRTLEDKLNHWRREVNKNWQIWCGPFGYCCANSVFMRNLWTERIYVALGVANAINYLHHESIIYRDLKPENIGFDIDGTVKIFDFGLAKRLTPDDRTASGLYRLTGNTGSLRYMAPEVASNQSYNLLADSYSFSIVFWQICALSVPYAGHNVRSHAEFVIGRGERPKIYKSWPLSWSMLMTSCWSTNIHERRDFVEIVQNLTEEYNTLISQSGQNPTDIKAKKKSKDDDIDIGLDRGVRRAYLDENGDTILMDQSLGIV
jgi:serine/threonine protein kinase